MFNSIDPVTDFKKKLKEFDFEPEYIEIKKGVFIHSSYPSPLKRFRLDIQGDNHNVEEVYYWMVGHARDDWAMPFMQKITDTHASSVSSSTFGDLQGRISNQQGGASNYLATMGKLLKDLFALVRELRQLQERLDYYTDSYEADEKNKRRSAEATLKDVWITLIEGGTNNPSSVYGMAQKVNFTILPDLFFAAPPFEDEAAVADYVESLTFNKSVKSAVERKLMQFWVWKKRTYQELTNKKSFQIRYLRQHFETIRMYMEWIKPYLKNLKRLGQNQDLMDDPHLINSFETSMSEIEVLLTQPPAGNDDDESGEKAVHPVVLFSFEFRTMPSLDYHAKESYHQKGPIHVGRTEVFMRAYAWTKEEIKRYQDYRASEDFEILTNFDDSIREAMDYLGEDLERFLDEAYKDNPESSPTKLLRKKREEINDLLAKDKEPEGNPNDSIGSIVFGPVKAIGELLSPLLPKGSSNASGSVMTLLTRSRFKAHKTTQTKNSKAKSNAEATARRVLYQVYKNYKKSHGIVSW